MIISLFLTMVPINSQAMPLTWEVEGIKGELKKNALLYLKALPAIEPKQFNSHKSRIIQAVNQALQALGYYQPDITVQLSAADNRKVLIQINPREPVIIKRLHIMLLGDAAKDSAFTNLLQHSPLQEGFQLNDGQYESLKSELSGLGAARGYFDAKISKHRIDVYPEKKIAIIYLTFDSGKRYTFGQINYGKMAPAIQKLLSTMVDIKSGTPYSAASIGKLTQSILSTGYFSQVNIYPQRQHIDDYKVPIYISVTPKLAHEFEVGAGFSTDEGPRFSASWKKPWANEHGNSLTNEVKISRTTNELTSSYKIPDGNPLQEYYNLQLGYQKKNLEDTYSHLLTTSIHRWHKRSLTRKGSWDHDLFFRIDYESYTQGNQSDNSLLLVPGISLSRGRVRGGIDPYWGDQELAKIEFSNKLWGSSANFIKLWGRSKWLRTYYKKHRMITRIEQGVILQLDNIADIPPSYRFFSGGDQSVRGYSYQSISPVDKDGNLTGGRYMTVGSIEYNYLLAPKWRLASFIDTGTVTNNYKDKWAVGTGFGIRWVTPIGQLKLDIACAIKEQGKPWQFHFTMASEL
ncbi:MAG: autotransporter assembly complex protein TamA [Endozoicomonas sp. (ex Botrylloides leachii)]|nr:autotransporter assembly complex protein TamA [Endozoicomonas sp. (ex Botrylloides leachii)]